MLKGKLLGQYIICEMVTTEKKMTVRKCRTINSYVNAGHINTPSEAHRHINKQHYLVHAYMNRKKNMQQMTTGKNMIKVDMQLPEN